MAAQSPTKKHLVVDLFDSLSVEQCLAISSWLTSQAHDMEIDRDSIKEEHNGFDLVGTLQALAIAIRPKYRH